MTHGTFVPTDGMERRERLDCQRIHEEVVMRTGRVWALVVGLFLLLPGVGFLGGGGALGLAYAVGRDDAGYFTAALDGLDTDTVAIVAGPADVVVDPGSPDWLVDRLIGDVRLRVAGTGPQDIFVGIARQSQVDAYLAGVAHAELTGTGGSSPSYRTGAGRDEISPPGSQTFWAAQVTGPGTQQLDWAVTGGRWSVVLMNADGSPGVAADANVAAKSDVVLPVALTLFILGAVLTAVALMLIVVGARDSRPRPPMGQFPDGARSAADGEARTTLTTTASSSPVTLVAHLDPGLSRWQWLVKWFLAIPHFFVLAFLWLAFALLTMVAGVAILFTGTYPRAIFDFNVGVLRWSWRVAYYAGDGGIGTDRYPPFSLEQQPDDPATLDVTYPQRLSRGLVLVKWWLLALPQYLIVAVIAGLSWGWVSDDDRLRIMPFSSGLLGLLVLVTGLVLLFSGRYPRALFDLIVGLNRWVYRVIAYAALMTDQYPPFRLDQGGAEPPATPGPPPLASPAGEGSEIDHRFEASR